MCLEIKHKKIKKFQLLYLPTAWIFHIVLKGTAWKNHNPLSKLCTKYTETPSFLHIDVLNNNNPKDCWFTTYFWNTILVTIIIRCRNPFKVVTIVMHTITKHNNNMQYPWSEKKNINYHDYNKYAYMFVSIPLLTTTRSYKICPLFKRIEINLTNFYDHPQRGRWVEKINITILKRKVYRI